MTDADSPLPDARPAHLRLDLRTVVINDVVDRVEQALGTRLDRAAAVRKRRTVGAPTDRGTWVRIECRGAERDTGQGWGLEAARVARGLPAPRWFAGVSWSDENRQATWRADEIEFVETRPLDRAAAADGLPDAWWTSLANAMDKLAQCRTTRRATPDCEPITSERVLATITKVFPSLHGIEVHEWSPAHADLVWSNLTGPTLWILDFEDFGLGPRGLDPACLWFASLATPTVEQKVRATLAGELESRSGRTMRLFKCAEFLAWADDSERLYAPARREANRLARELGWEG